MSKQEGSNINLWTGTPVFWSPAPIDSEKTTRVFHRDHPGEVIAEFIGLDHRKNAELFCQLFGQKNGSKQAMNDREHEAAEREEFERRIEQRREEVERFDVPTDAQVVARLPHDKRGCPIVPGYVVRWCGELWTVRAISSTNNLALKQTTPQGGERGADTYPGAVEVVSFGKPFLEG